MKKTNKGKITKKVLMQEVLKLLVIILAAAVHGLGSYAFVAPNGFIAGGVTGIAIMIAHATGIAEAQGYALFLLNIPMIILAIIFLGKRFTFHTFAFIFVESAFLLLYSFLKLPQYIFDTPLLGAIAGGVCMGVGLALCLRTGGSTGGTDIIGIIVQKKFPAIRISWYLFAINGIIVAASFFVYEDGMQAVLLSIILEFVMTRVSDFIISGAAGAVRFEVITTKGEEMQKAIISRMHRGATVFDAKGAYSNEGKSVIVCVIHKRQIAEFKKMLKEVDPEAFAYHYKTTEVMGKGFSDKN